MRKICPLETQDELMASMCNGSSISSPGLLLLRLRIISCEVFERLQGSAAFRCAPFILYLSHVLNETMGFFIPRFHNRARETETLHVHVRRPQDFNFGSTISLLNERNCCLGSCGMQVKNHVPNKPVLRLFLCRYLLRPKYILYGHMQP